MGYLNSNFFSKEISRQLMTACLVNTWEYNLVTRHQKYKAYFKTYMNRYLHFPADILEEHFGYALNEINTMYGEWKTLIRTSSKII